MDAFVPHQRTRQGTPSPLQENGVCLYWRNRLRKMREMRTDIIARPGIGKAGARQQGDSNGRYQARFHRY